MVDSSYPQYLKSRWLPYKPGRQSRSLHVLMELFVWSSHHLFKWILLTSSVHLLASSQHRDCGGGMPKEGSVMELLANCSCSRLRLISLAQKEDETMLAGGRLEIGSMTSEKY